MSQLPAPPPGPLLEPRGAAAPPGASGASGAGRVPEPAPQPARPPALSATPDVGALLRALRRRWALALVVGLLTATLAGAGAWLVVPAAQYTARSTLHVSMHPPKVMFTTAETPAEYGVFQKTQASLITSRMVLGAVLRDPEVSRLETVREAARRMEPIEWLEQQVKVEADKTVIVRLK